MWIESLQPLRVRRLVDVVNLRPGLPVEFDEAEGQRLLSRAPGKVKIVALASPSRFTEGMPVLVRRETGPPLVRLGRIYAAPTIWRDDAGWLVVLRGSRGSLVVRP
jgi:hypothetical protein